MAEKEKPPPGGRPPRAPPRRPFEATLAPGLRPGAGKPPESGARPSAVRRAVDERGALVAPPARSPHERPTANRPIADAKGVVHAEVPRWDADATAEDGAWGDGAAEAGQRLHRPAGAMPAVAPPPEDEPPPAAPSRPTAKGISTLGPAGKKR